MVSDSKKWQHFERLVAAIHQAADQGAEVRWDEMINGRQFDVTIRFRSGLYEYLTVVECKDYGKAVPVDKVEAFVTKSADAHAHHAVVASTYGFQQGAQEVARKHNMTLIHVTESADIDVSVFGAQFVGDIDALHIHSIALEYADGETKHLAEQSHQMTYYVNNIVVRCGSEQGTLDQIVQNHASDFLGGEVDRYKDHILDCPSGTHVVGPNDGEIPLKSLARVHIRAGMTKAKALTGPVMFDPYLIIPDVKVRNVLTGEEQIFQQHCLAFGTDTVFQQGTFYEQSQLASYYYCDKIEGDIAFLYLVESFQLGRLFQAQFTVETKTARYYVPVSDKDIILRLRHRLHSLKAK